MTTRIGRATISGLNFAAAIVNLASCARLVSSEDATTWAMIAHATFAGLSLATGLVFSRDEK